MYAFTQKMDPQMRKLLEVSWEAWVDSGVDMNKLRGSSRVGVYIGCCGSEVSLILPYKQSCGLDKFWVLLVLMP